MDQEKKREILRRFGEHLGKLKQESGLSYRKLAARCDVDYSDFRKYEKGEKDLQFSTIVDMAQALGVHPSKMMDFEFPEMPE